MDKIGNISVRIFRLKDLIQIAPPPRFFNIFPWNIQNMCIIGLLSYMICKKIVIELKKQRFFEFGSQIVWGLNQNSYK